MKLLVAFCLASWFACASDWNRGAADDKPVVKPEDELKKLVGKWALIAQFEKGEDKTDGGVSQGGEIAYFTFKANKTFVIKKGEKVIEEGTWTIDTTTTPKRFDHKVTVGAAALIGRTSLGLYECAGDILKFCVADPGTKRPARFQAKPDTGCTIFVMKRVPE
jgi:uncharacterized protein (TIGR03067 family)